MDACSGGENEPDETNEADSEYVNDTDEDEATTKTCVEQSSQTTDDLLEDELQVRIQVHLDEFKKTERKLKKEIESVNKRWEDHIQFVTKAKNDKIASIEQELDEQTKATERLQRALNEEKKKFEEKLRIAESEKVQYDKLKEELEAAKQIAESEKVQYDKMKEELEAAKQIDESEKLGYDKLKKELEAVKQQNASELNARDDAYQSLFDQLITNQREYETYASETKKKYDKLKKEKDANESLAKQRYDHLKKEKDENESSAKQRYDHLKKEKDENESSAKQRYDKLKKEKDANESYAKQKYDKLKEGKSMIEKQKKEAEKNLREYAVNYERLRKSYEEKKKLCQMHEYCLQACHLSNSDLEAEVSGLKEYIRCRDADVAKLEANVANLEAEKRYLLMRLSKMAGKKLTDLNPAIADLSDVFRPTKLAEMFSEVYDNEWTDAFEERCGFQDEEDAIIFILKILHKTYDLCKGITQQQQEDLIRKASTLRIVLPGPEADTSTVESPTHAETEPMKETTSEAVTEDVFVNMLEDKEISKTLDEEELTALKEIQKATAYVLSKEAEKTVTEILKVHLRIDDEASPNTVAYLRKCVFLCWKMVLHDPPLYVDHVAADDNDPNLHERYRAYTKIGTKLQYLVWPALFLHKDGAVLNKGVAKFTNS